MSAKYTNANLQDDDDKEVESKLNKLTNFLYDKKCGKVCGRRCKSWGLLMLFYTVFYTCLALLWLIVLLVFLYGFISWKEPLRSGNNSILELTPGVNVYPRLSIEGALIIASIRESSYLQKEYLKSVDKFFTKSFRENPLLVNCSDDKTPQNVSQFCLFDKTSLGPCADPKRELMRGRLCVFIRINKIFGWLPSVENHSLSNDTFIHCEGQYPGDKSNLGEPIYYPSFGSTNSTSFGIISNKFFPFINQENYTSPMVAVQFPFMSTDVVILVQCMTKNLRKSFKPIKFEIMLSTKA